MVAFCDDNKSRVWRRSFLRIWLDFDEVNNINKEEKDEDDERSKENGKYH